MLDRIENRAFPCQASEPAPAGPGEACETAAGACKILRLTPSGLGQARCAVDRPPMTSGEAESRGQLHAFQWAPWLYARSVIQHLSHRHIACSTTRRPPCSADARVRQQSAQLRSATPVKLPEPAEAAVLTGRRRQGAIIHLCV